MCFLWGTDRIFIYIRRNLVFKGLRIVTAQDVSYKDSEEGFEYGGVHVLVSRMMQSCR
jgi:hypothetical protein